MANSTPLLLATDMKIDWRPLVAATGKLAVAWSRPVVPVHVVTVDTDSVLVDYYRRQLTQQLFEPFVSATALLPVGRARRRSAQCLGVNHQRNKTSTRQTHASQKTPEPDHKRN